MATKFISEGGKPPTTKAQVLTEAQVELPDSAAFIVRGVINTEDDPENPYARLAVYDADVSGELGFDQLYVSADADRLDEIAAGLTALAESLRKQTPETDEA
jgi:hypothetical protein